MENSKGNYYKHPQFANNVTRSPHFLQSKSRTTTVDAHKHASKSRLPLLNLSKSKSCKAEETTLTSRNDRKKLKESRDDSSKFLLRSQSKMEVPKRTRSAGTSPSAWALSPGRSSHPLPMPQPVSVPKSPITLSTKSKRDSCSTKSSSGVSGVLKYFGKKKKVSPAQEEEYHQFRIMHNRLLQWRFANARAEVSMTNLKRFAHKKIFNVWLRTSILRNFIMEKRIQLQKFKRDIKLYNILSSEINLLKEWARLESKNCEAVGRLARKLSAISVRLPLEQGAKADITSFLDAMSMATKVMENIEAMTTNIQEQVEQTCYMLTELSVIVKEQKDRAIKLENCLDAIALLVAQETSLRLRCIQLHEETRRVSFFNKKNSHP